MITAAELQLLRSMDGGALLPGIDFFVGNPLPLASLTSYTSISTNWQAGIRYLPSLNTVVVTQAGAVVSGINFGGATLVIEANNVTVENCTFSSCTGYYSIQQQGSASATIVENCTFTGTTDPDSTSGPFICANNSITITSNSFTNAPTSAIHVASGAVVTGNYIDGGGFNTAGGTHADAIVVNGAQGALISDNFIDWEDVTNPNLLGQPIRVTANQGNCINVTVSGNFLIGGAYSIDAGNQTSNGYTFSNINVTGNYIGFSDYGAYDIYGAAAGNFSGNTIFDFGNTSYSTNAWAADQASGLGTTTLLVSTGANIAAAPTGSTTLYGAGYQVYLSGSNGENIFVGGSDTQYLQGGHGANIYDELAFSDSPAGHYDVITNFDTAKDVIDLSRIDADPATAGLQNFTFIGTAALGAAGDQVHVRQDVANNCTWVEATMAGDSTPDLVIKLYGLQTLSAANFALTASQSQADLAAAAALTLSVIQAPTGGAKEYAYTNVQGQAYSSFQEIYDSSQVLAADDYVYSPSVNQLALTGADATTITRSATGETLAVGSSSFSLGLDPTETIQANAGADAFLLGQNFGAETINGFKASGANLDTIQLSKSAFSYLTAGMSQAQDLAAVLTNATSGAFGITINDSLGDSLTLAGITAATITTDASHFKFV